MTPAQCRGARGLLDLTQPDLAKLAGVKRSAITDYERQRSISKTMVEKIQTALEAQGIEFTNGKKLGVRLRPR